MATTYHGNCHCGRFRLRLTSDEITEVIMCDCTLCAKKGYLWLNAPPDSLEVTRDEGSITVYRSSALEDKFCSHCGTPVTGTHLVGPLQGQPLVNIRTLQGVNPFSVKYTPTRKPSSYITLSGHAGADAEQKQRFTIAKTLALEGVSPTDGVPALAPPQPLAGPPAAALSSCHCGKVQAELLVPLTELQVKEDNCSFCVRNAYIGTYPTKDQVRIHGREDTFEYRRKGGFSGIVHCKTCGVTVFSNVYGPPLSVFDRLPPERKERALQVYHKNMALQPLNVRTLNGVDVGALQIERTDEGTEGYVLPP